MLGNNDVIIINMAASLNWWRGKSCERLPVPQVPTVDTSGYDLLEGCRQIGCSAFGSKCLDEGGGLGSWSAARISRDRERSGGQHAQFARRVSRLSPDQYVTRGNHVGREPPHP